MHPITVDEAIEEMEAVGHDFYVFRELESDAIQVLATAAYYCLLATACSLFAACVSQSQP